MRLSLYYIGVQEKYKLFFSLKYLTNKYLLQKYFIYVSWLYKFNLMPTHFWFYKFKRPIYNNKVRRFSYLKSYLTVPYIKKNFLLKQIKSGKSFGKIICRSKRKSFEKVLNTTYTSLFLFNKLHMPSHIYKPNVFAHFSIKMLTNFGEIYYIPGNFKIKLFKIYHTYLYTKHSNKLITDFKFYYYFLHMCKVWTKLSNVTLTFSYKFQLARAKGSYLTIEYFHTNLKFVCVQLPSKMRCYLDPLMVGFKGYLDDNNLKYPTKITKHSVFKKAGYKSIVRGVAKNPVDHPNGGNTKAKSPYKTPWGRVVHK